MFYSPFRNLFIPSFLHCWNAKQALEKMFVSCFKNLFKKRTTKANYLNFEIIIILALPEIFSKGKSYEADKSFKTKRLT